MDCVHSGFQAGIESNFDVERKTQGISVLMKQSRLTPAQEVVPVQMLLLCEHSHHDEGVQVDAFTQHPEVIAAQHVHVEEV